LEKIGTRKEGLPMEAAPPPQPAAAQVPNFQSNFQCFKFLNFLNFVQQGDDGGSILCVSSPMRRALMTAAPCAAALGCPLVCHGGLFEYACAGLAEPGTTPSELQADWPELRCVGFSPTTGHWDYQGTNAKETEDETRQRGERFLGWLGALLRAVGSN
jgi:broad specificity phosphatase PhoE